MRIINWKKSGLNFCEIWSPEISDIRNIKTDILFVKGCAIDYGQKFNLQHTLVTSLLDDVDSIFNRITSKTFKYDIRRSNKDDIKVIVYDSNELKNNREIVDEFCDCYNSMFATKGLPSRLSYQELKKYIDQDAMFLTVAKTNGHALVFHSYIDRCDSIRLWHSCSNFRLEKEMATIIGRTNKRLHFDDMCYYKEKGYIEYDWGGVFSYDSQNGIDLFKKAFGGTPCDYYNGIIGISLKGKIVVRAKKILKRVIK